MIRAFSQLSVLIFSACLISPSIVEARPTLQCVPFARQVSGIDIRGNAKTWWGQAEGRYDRGQSPREGAVLAMPGSGRMRLGHVAMVSKIVNDREILLTHANWSHRGGIERDVRAIDVSDKGDWSRVRIWYAGNGDLGITSYPAYGFIYASRSPKQDRAPLLSDEILRMASIEQYGVGNGGIALLR